MEKIQIAELIFYISLTGSVVVGFFMFFSLCGLYTIDYIRKHKFIKYALFVCLFMCFGWCILSWYMDTNNITTLPLDF